MTDVLPLILLFTAWIPLAAAVAWVFERRPRLHARRAHRAPKPNI
jgi:hypothetical protein